MGLVEELEARTVARLPGTPCYVGRALAVLPVDDRRAILEALDRKETITATVISDWFREKPREIEVGDQSIRKHRQGKCKCRFSTS